MGTPHPVLSTLVWVPKSLFTHAQGWDLRERLTIRVRGFESEEVREIRQYSVDRVNEMVGLPVHYGLEYLREMGLSVTRNLCPGYPVSFPGRPDAHHPSAPADQAELMRTLLARVREHPVTLVKAPTGSGKTVVALNTIAELGCTALVIAKTRVLARQWEKEAIRHLGLSKEDIGFVMSGEARFERRKLVIAVLANLYLKEWLPEFYNYFGTVVWDEAHILGAEKFSQTLSQFAARYRIALTATPNRRDGAERLFLDYFGEPSVFGRSDALPVECRVITRTGFRLPWWATKHGSILQALTMDEERNADIAALIQALYSMERNVIILSDRIAQLDRLWHLCRDVPEEKLGWFARQRVTGYNGRKVKTRAVKDAELDHTIANAQVIFATYGMAKEALDIPRLDAGIDASPRADGVQAIGRLRRPFPDKPMPVFYTIRDKGVALLEAYTRSRLTDYRSANVTIIDPEA